MNKEHMAIDQYGHTYHALGKDPRKALCDRLGHKRAERMYIDRLNGSPVHIGYIIGGLWLTVYHVKRMERSV